MEEPTEPATEAAEYRHADGTVEIVFAADEGRVLTVREYPDEATFERAIAPATYRGEHPGIADLPGIEAFEED